MSHRYRWNVGYDNDASYTSHAHGWSTGPTPALTFYVLGLKVTSPLGQSWRIAPVLSGLPSAEGGFTTGLGWFGVKWTIDKTSIALEINLPGGTSGQVVLPVSGATTVDGEAVKGSELALDGGKHTILVALN